MSASTVSYRGFEIVVRAETNTLGAWVANVSLKDSAGKVVELRPMTVQPEWLTEQEAVRDAVEWGRRFIDREFNTPQPHSWVAERSRAEVWFRDTEEKRATPAVFPSESPRNCAPATTDAGRADKAG